MTKHTNDWTGVDVARIWRHADEIAEPRNRQTRTVDDVDRMWALFRLAVQTSRRYPSPPRMGWSGRSCMPEGAGELTYREMVALYLQEGGELPPAFSGNTRPKPNAFEISLTEYVLWLFHRYALNGRRSKLERRKAVYQMAEGCPVVRLRRECGLSRQMLYRLRNAAMEDMIRGAKI